jgi:hypothetical protein
MTQSQLPVIRPVSEAMRRMLWVASVLVFIAGAQLLILTEDTDTFFAWTIEPPLTAAFLGGCYWSAGILEYMASRERVWANARIAVPAVLLFTILTLVATLLHLDRFHLNSTNFLTLGATWAWIAIYAFVPILMSLFLVRQLREPGGDPPRQAPLPIWLRSIIIVQTAVMILFGLALFLAPQPTLVLWPWQLTPLTSRAVAAWLLGLGIAAGQIVWENDYVRVRVLPMTVITFSVLQFLALARYPSNMNWGTLNAWLYILFLLSFLAVGVYAWYASRQIGRGPISP